MPFFSGYGLFRKLKCSEVHLSKYHRFSFVKYTYYKNTHSVRFYFQSNMLYCIWYYFSFWHFPYPTQIEYVPCMEKQLREKEETRGKLKYYCALPRYVETSTFIQLCNLQIQPSCFGFMLREVSVKEPFDVPMWSFILLVSPPPHQTLHCFVLYMDIIHNYCLSIHEKLRGS